MNICPKKSETVYPGIWGILKLSVLVNQKIFKKIIDSHCALNVKETLVCVWVDILPHHHTSQNCLLYIFFDLKCGGTSAHIFCICLVQNCLSQVKISETVCKSVWVLKLSVLKRTGKVLFIHPCVCILYIIGLQARHCLEVQWAMEAAVSQLCRPADYQDYCSEKPSWSLDFTSKAL